jgi:hypothetical protein
MENKLINASQKTKIVISETGIKPEGKNSFEGKVFNSTNFKIYILKHVDDYLYVGKTKQKIGTKFLQGFRSHNKDLNGERQAGYGGYKWITPYKNTNEILQLYVFDLGSSCTDNYTEAIEAEIVFGIRKTSNKWPLWQNEIHFFNEYPDASNEAKTILDETRD